MSSSSVRLISYSQPPVEASSLQDLVAFCARVSNPANQMNTQTNERLIKYLIQHNHWSPLEMVSVCLEIETTRDIARQILRHRSFSFQEFSQRYATVETTAKITREARLQDTRNRQNSIELSAEYDDEQYMLKEQWEQVQERVAEVAADAYTWALDNGIAKEQARVVLPEGLTKSRLYMNGTLRSWIHYIQLRTGNGTQKEHREVAEQCAAVIAGIFPLLSTLLPSSGSTSS